MRTKILFCWCVLVLIATSIYATEISLSTLLDEMVDRTALARFPDPTYVTKQFSSYDRRSRSPVEHRWYSNDDYSNFVREETNGGRKEWVMADAEGPGVITRWWITGDRYVTTIRVYLDGNSEPALVARADELVGGNFLCAAPLSTEKARGRNLYLPIPYKKSIKITADNLPEQGKFYYAINYRTYETGTNIRSFSMNDLNACREKLNTVSQILEGKDEPLFQSEDETVAIEGQKVLIPPGESKGCSHNRTESGAAIVGLEIKLMADDPTGKFLRNTILSIAFDFPEDGPQVLCPVSDFFGSGLGLNPHKTWYSEVEQDGTMRSFWVMPYKNDWTIVLENGGDVPVTAEWIVKTEPLPWTKRSMYFHCNWRQERNIQVRQDHCERDWEFARLRGEGVFVGDVLALWNADRAWWGEGDEKIYVDGEKFPSHHGTGTEDYYGYAWATVDFFDAPFHAQPRVEGPANFGHTTNLRYRSLDAIPFKNLFRFDMELWHWVSTQVDYAATVFWYGKQAAKMDGPLTREQVVTEARQSRDYRSPKPLPTLRGLNLVAMTGGTARMQDMKDFSPRQWGNNDQVLWEGSQLGDVMELEISCGEEEKTLVAKLTKAFDYGVFQFLLDGKEIGEPVDLYQAGDLPDCVVPTTIILGKVGPSMHRIGIKNVGKNEQSHGVLFGMDELLLVDDRGVEKK